MGRRTIEEERHGEGSGKNEVQGRVGLNLKFQAERAAFQS